MERHQFLGQVVLESHGSCTLRKLTEYVFSSDLMSLLFIEKMDIEQTWNQQRRTTKLVDSASVSQFTDSWIGFPLCGTET